MKVSDYIVEFLLEKQIEHVFGYPGGMVTHLMDSFSKYRDKIQAHVCYHEQAAAFEACAYAQASNKMGVAYATSGPGATNMVTGICNAYFDSIPVLFITGQVNTFEAKTGYQIRQRGFQETNIVDMVKDVTKYSVYVDSPESIAYELEKAYKIALSGRKGPVLLDIPMNVQRADIQPQLANQYTQEEQSSKEKHNIILEKLRVANRPSLILGAGLKGISKEKILSFVEKVNIPVVTSMLGVDMLPTRHPLNYGFIGAYGSRVANFIVAKSDLILTLGSRLDVRQVGGKRENFAPGAILIRVDIDKEELEYQIRENEIDICADAEDVLEYLKNNYTFEPNKAEKWIGVCQKISDELEQIDERKYNLFVKNISELIPENTVITTDVGQNQVWVAQSFEVKKGQQILFSGGHGAMGYSLPAAIGAYYATKRPVICFNGDGGIQMNIQEMEFIRREGLPIKIIVFNNYALGMIRHFQEMYFENKYVQTVNSQGYTSPDFQKLAYAYDMDYFAYETLNDVSDEFLQVNGSALVEIKLPEKTYVYPKLEFGKPNQDQEPLIDRELFQELMEL